eukprot:TRINITY_DN67960_c7_g6_i1.p2 TRINITY_DN67960_c7_g6~~TRINITY_DN67960_c7_g6_i1.p2  ORF type:complete len:114 (-),score=10.85 TRINITY_DN67960_c7_g6_i1:720-1061(-)
MDDWLQLVQLSFMGLRTGKYSQFGDCNTLRYQEGKGDIGKRPRALVGVINNCNKEAEECPSQKNKWACAVISGVALNNLSTVLSALSALWCGLCLVSHLWQHHNSPTIRWRAA